MRTGRLSIARGFPAPDFPEEPVRLALVSAAAAASSAPILTDALVAVHARLDALERLTRLCEAGALTIEEFLAEKAAILGHPRSALLEPRAEGEPPISFAPAGPRGRSLLSRLGWTILPLGLVGGLVLAALTQPEMATQIWQEGLRLFGL